MTSLLAVCQGSIVPLLPVEPIDESPAIQVIDTSGVDETQATPGTGLESKGSDNPESVDTGSNITVSDEPSDENLEEIDGSEALTANILVSSLRLRAGPGVDYDVLGAALSGEAFEVTGQAFDCQWLNGLHPTLGTVWFSGAAQYTSLNVDCDQVPPAEVPAPPAQPATSQPATVQPAAAQPDAEAESVPTQSLPPQPTAPAPAAVEPEPTAQQQTSAQGCYLFQGYAGPALTVEISAVDHDWSTTVDFSGDSGQRYCFTPGPYIVAIVSPAIWKGRGTGFDVQPGVHNLAVADLLR